LGGYWAFISSSVNLIAGTDVSEGHKPRPRDRIQGCHGSVLEDMHHLLAMILNGPIVWVSANVPWRSRYGRLAPSY